MFGDLGIELCKEDKVLFYAFGIGNEKDIHAISFSGNGIEVDGNNKDSVMIFPGKTEHLFKIIRMTYPMNAMAEVLRLIFSLHKIFCYQPVNVRKNYASLVLLASSVGVKSL